MDALTIGRASPRDWRRLRAVRLRALADTPDAFGSTLAQAEALPTFEWRRRLDEKTSATFLASIGGRDVGLVVGRPWESGGDEAAGLFAMWVAPAARGNGVGTTLVGAAIDWAQEEGYARIFLDVADANAPAIALYASLGFVATGKTGSLPPPRDHIPEHELALELA